MATRQVNTRPRRVNPALLYLFRAVQYIPTAVALADITRQTEDAVVRVFETASGIN